MRRARRIASFGAAATGLLLSAGVAAQTPPAAPGGAAAPAPAGPLATSGFQTGEVEAQVTEAVRKGGILTVKVRFAVADGASFPSNVSLYSNAREGYQEAYVVAGDKKYFALKDAEGAPLMPPEVLLMRRREGAGGQVGLWWGKFPAPPAGVGEFSLTLPKTAPLDGIPIRDG